MALGHSLRERPSGQTWAGTPPVTCRVRAGVLGSATSPGWLEVTEALNMDPRSRDMAVASVGRVREQSLAQTSRSSPRGPTAGRGEMAVWSC